MASRQSKRPISEDPGTSTSTSRPHKKTKKTHSSKEDKALAAKAKEELRLHQAIERSIKKALKEASSQEGPSQPGPVISQTVPRPSPTQEPDPTHTPDHAPSEPSVVLPSTLPPLSPDGASQASPSQGEMREALFGAPSGPAPMAPLPQTQVSQEPSTLPNPAIGFLQPPPNFPPEWASFIQQAIRQGIQSGSRHNPSSWVSGSASSIIDVEGSHLDQDQEVIGAAATTAAASDHGSLLDLEDRDLDLSEDEDLPPDNPPFVGLFKPQLFRSLLHKAKLVTGLGSSRPTNPGEGPSSSVPLFEDPVVETEEIPSSKLFKEVLKKQWASPASGPNPNQLDRRLYNLAPELASLLQIPTVDPPIAALASTSTLTGSPEDNLRPEDKRLEQSILKTHQAATWAANSSLASSFFNRASILWLRQLLTKLPVADTRTFHDLSKILAALEFSADATLNASRFAAKAIGSSITSRRLLWLRYWQADAKSKWRLASSKFEGPNLFGAPLEPLLIETKDKRRVLPSVSRRSEFRPSGQPSRPFRSPGSPYSGARSSRGFPPRTRAPDRQGFQTQRGQYKRPVRGGRGRPFRRYR